jgi:lipoprotein
MLEECEKKAEPLMANSNCSNANKAQASIRRMNTRGVNFSN